MSAKIVPPQTWRKGLRYSGDKSKQFWDRVNALPSPDYDVLYTLGCELQSLEERTMRHLDNAERAGTSPRPPQEWAPQRERRSERTRVPD